MFRRHGGTSGTDYQKTKEKPLGKYHDKDILPVNERNARFMVE